LNNGYGDVPPGELTALFGISGYLEIAINQGNASKLLGLRMRDPIRIEFAE
jgi:S-adenosylmethionine hydrolase